MAKLEITKQLRPGILRVTDTDRIGMLHCFFRQQCDMRPAEHNRNASLPELPRQLVTSRGRARDHSHADQVGIQVQGNILNPFVEKRYISVQFVGHERRQRG